MTAPFSLPLHLFPLAYARSRSSEIDSEIATLEMSISKLKAERAILGIHLSSYIYPVLTLPNEVISEIFLQSLDPADPPFPPSNSTLTGSASPLYLGHICQRWRDIALSTPSLWTVISLTTSVRIPHSRLRLLDIWLTRSRQCPLSVTIADNGWPTLARQFVDAIAPHHRRLQVLRLKVGHEDLPKWQSELPLLRVLHIYPMHWSAYTQPPDRVSPLFLSAPNLNTVAIHSNHRAMFPLPWEQLTSVSILTHGCLDNATHVLRKAPNLTDFTAELGQFSSLLGLPDIELPPIPPLMHLRNLVLLRAPAALPSTNTALQTRILGILTLPKLHRLDVGAPLVSAAAALITRSSCPLELLQTVLIAHTYYLPLLTPEGRVELLKFGGGDDESNTTDEEDSEDEDDDDDEEDDEEDSDENDEDDDSHASDCSCCY
ncbi:hypothetical protein C8R47DRAFT_8409 [Mycena vitilis]|nr:hypothetical protein C8R47DRAFT_8409 [Mycena vitilis]